jgi:hypothetical protein
MEKKGDRRIRVFGVTSSCSVKIKCTESLYFHFHSLCAVRLALIDSSDREYSWEGVAIASAGSQQKHVIQPYEE